MSILGGKSEEENHAHLPQFRTVGETVWGLGLNSSEEPLGPCGEDDGSSESGRGIPSASPDPPRHRPDNFLPVKIFGQIEGYRVPMHAACRE